MPRPNRARELAEFLDVEGRVWRRPALVKRYGREALETAMRGRLVVPMLPGLVAHAARADEFMTRLNAANAWLPSGTVVSGLAALSLHQLTDVVPKQITVLVRKSLHRQVPPWLRVLRTAPVTRVQMRGQVRCSTRERAVIDAWCEARPEDRVSLVLEAMRRSSLAGDDVMRVLGGMPRVADGRRLIATLQEAREGIESFLEHRAKRTILNTPDFRCLRRQVDVVAMGNSYTLDTFHEPSRTVIEFDGARVHGSFAAKTRDNARDAALATLDMVTLRIGYEDVMKRPEWCREVIRRTIAARAGGRSVRLSGV